MNMKHTNRRKDNLNEPLFDLNKSSTGCAPCLKEAVKIDRQISQRPLNEIKTKEIKKIVRSIFNSYNTDT